MIIISVHPFYIDFILKILIFNQADYTINMFPINELEYVHADQLTLSERYFKLLLKSCYIYPDYKLHIISLVLFSASRFLNWL